MTEKLFLDTRPTLVIGSYFDQSDCLQIPHTNGEKYRSRGVVFCHFLHTNLQLHKYLYVTYQLHVPAVNVMFLTFVFDKTKISYFDHNFDFWPKFRFFWIKFWFLTKISIFDKISISDKNFDFWRKFRFLTKILIFDQNFDVWVKLRFLWKFGFLTKISIFVQNFDFWH